MELLLLVCSYSDRADQLRLMRLMLSTKDYAKFYLPALEHLSVTPMNPSEFSNIKQRGIQQAIGDECYLYFNRLLIRGTEDSLAHLKSNSSNVIFTLMHLIAFRKKLKNNTTDSVDIDAFVSRKKLQKDIFAEGEAYSVRQDKLENLVVLSGMR